MKIEELDDIVKENVEQAIKFAQNCINRLNFNNISNKAQLIMQQMKKQIDRLNKRNQIAITINNTQSQNQISQLEKEIDSLQKKIHARKIVLNMSSALQTPISLTETDIYNDELDEAKSKMSQLKQESSQTGSIQTKLTTMFTLFKDKISQSIGNISNMKNVFSKMPTITKNITKNVKAIGNGIKNGLANVFKFARKSFVYATNIFYFK